MVTEDTFLERHLNKIIAALGIVGLVLSAAVLWFYWHVFGANLSGEHERWAQFGDYIGGILGSVFALLALIALLITLRLQSKELKNSAIELRNSAEALKEQSQSIVIQNFENRFFNMLSLHHQIVNTISFTSNPLYDERFLGRQRVSVTKRKCFRMYYYRLREWQITMQHGDSADRKVSLNVCYDKFYETCAYELGHYFRFVYRILKFINDNKVQGQKEYSGVLRAQLSNPELALLFYNGLSLRGEKFKLLAEEYALFENIEPSTLLDYELDRQLYKPEAFGDLHHEED